MDEKKKEEESKREASEGADRKDDVEAERTNGMEKPRERPNPSRASLVEQAVSFLGSAAVKTASRERQDGFLEKKGLTRDEIDEVRRRVEGAQDGAELQPEPAPDLPRGHPPVDHAVTWPLQTRPPPLAAPTSATAPMSLATYFNRLAMTMLASGTLSLAALSLYRATLLPMIEQVYRERREYAAHERALLLAFLDKAAAVVASGSGGHGSNEGRPTDGADVLVSADPLARLGDGLADLSRTMTRLLPRADEGHTTAQGWTSRSRSRAELYDTLTKFNSYLSTNLYLSSASYSAAAGAPSDTAGDGGVAALKSEIRSLKGILLNRRNFPVPAKVESATPAVGETSLEKGQPGLAQGQARDDLVVRE